MKKIQKFTVSEIHAGVYVVDNTSDSHSSQMFCPICKFAMSSFSDTESFKKNKCCETCRIKFVEPRKKEWSAGWRPTKAEVEKYVNSFSFRPNSFQIK